MPGASPQSPLYNQSVPSCEIPSSQAPATEPHACPPPRDASSVPYALLLRSHRAGQQFGRLGNGEHPPVVCEVCSERSLITTPGMGWGGERSRLNCCELPAQKANRRWLSALLPFLGNSAATRMTLAMHTSTASRVTTCEQRTSWKTRSSLRCQLTELCQVGSWSSLQDLHSSRFPPHPPPTSPLPEIPLPGTNVNTERHCKSNKQANSHPLQRLVPFQVASLPYKAGGADPPLAPAPAGKPHGSCGTFIRLPSPYVS